MVALINVYLAPGRCYVRKNAYMRSNAPCAILMQSEIRNCLKRFRGRFFVSYSQFCLWHCIRFHFELPPVHIMLLGCSGEFGSVVPECSIDLCASLAWHAGFCLDLYGACKLCLAADDFRGIAVRLVTLRNVGPGRKNQRLLFCGRTGGGLLTTQHDPILVQGRYARMTHPPGGQPRQENMFFSDEYKLI